MGLKSTGPRNITVTQACANQQLLCEIYMKYTNVHGRKREEGLEDKLQKKVNWMFTVNSRSMNYSVGKRHEEKFD